MKEDITLRKVDYRLPNDSTLNSEILLQHLTWPYLFWLWFVSNYSIHHVFSLSIASPYLSFKPQLIFNSFQQRITFLQQSTHVHTHFKYNHHHQYNFVHLSSNLLCISVFIIPTFNFFIHVTQIVQLLSNQFHFISSNKMTLSSSFKLVKFWIVDTITGPSLQCRRFSTVVMHTKAL